MAERPKARDLRSADGVSRPRKGAWVQAEPPRNPTPGATVPTYGSHGMERPFVLNGGRRPRSLRIKRRVHGHVHRLGHSPAGADRGDPSRPKRRRNRRILAASGSVVAPRATPPGGRSHALACPRLGCEETALGRWLRSDTAGLSQRRSATARRSRGPRWNCVKTAREDVPY